MRRLYIQNAFWLMLEKLFYAFFTFGVMLVVARVLGPSDYGVLSYAMALVGIVGALGHMGLDGLVVREIVKQPQGAAITLGTSFVLKAAGMLLAFALITSYALLVEGADSGVFIIIIIVSVAVLLRPWEVVGFWFLSVLQAKYSALARILAVLLSSTYRLAVLATGLGVVWVAWGFALQALLVGLLLIWFYHRRGHSITQWKFTRARARELFSQSWLVYVGSIFALINLKADQVMLRQWGDMTDVGVYALAAQFSEALYFVPTAIVASLFPRLISLRESSYEVFVDKMQSIFDLLCVLAVLIAVIMSCLFDPVVRILLGDQYSPATPILLIHVWGGVFVFMRALLSRWILIENALVFSLITQGLGALVNVVLNWWAIPRYGGEGAAVVTVLSYAVSGYFALLFSSKTRKVFMMMTKSMAFLVRYPYNYYLQRVAR